MRVQISILCWASPRTILVHIDIFRQNVQTSRHEGGSCSSSSGDVWQVEVYLLICRTSPKLSISGWFVRISQSWFMLSITFSSGRVVQFSQLGSSWPLDEESCKFEANMLLSSCDDTLERIVERNIKECLECDARGRKFMLVFSMADMAGFQESSVFWVSFLLPLLGFKDLRLSSLM